MVSLQDLPREVLIRVCSFLDEQDVLSLQVVSREFRSLLQDQEFWKQLVNQRLATLNFPCVSREAGYMDEFYERKYLLNTWKHNKVVKNKYTINPYRPGNIDAGAIERCIFQYPRCYLYNEGTITIAQLNKAPGSAGGANRKKFTYIPCTTPQGCSTMDFNMNAAVFGRFDGRVFAKLLTKNTFLTPVVEFDQCHTNRSCVTAINIMMNSQFESGKSTICVSGSELGEIIWWQDNTMLKRLQLSTQPIIKLFLYQWDSMTNYTVAMDSALNVYVVVNKDTVSTLSLITDVEPLQNLKINDIHFIKIDFGDINLIISTIDSLYVVSLDIEKDFGHCTSFHISSLENQQLDPIKDLYIDETTALTKRDHTLAGSDGCYIGLVTQSNEILIINIREKLSNQNDKLRLHKRLIFNEIINSCQLNNLILAVTLNDNLKILDPTTGDLLKTVNKVDRGTQYIKICDNKIITTTGNTLNYYQFNSTSNAATHHGKKRSHHGPRGKNIVSNKWNMTLNSAKKLFDEEEDRLQDRIRENNRLLDEYGGDIEELTNEDDINLRIALLESQSTNNQQPTISTSNTQLNEDEELKRAIEESERLQHLNEHGDDEDEEFRRALELSRQEQDQQSEPRTIRRSRLPLSDESTPHSATPQQTNTQTHPQSSNNTTEDEDLALAIALSLSEINN